MGLPATLPPGNGSDPTDGGPDVSAVVVDSPGATPRLGSIGLPRRPSGTTLLEVVAAPLNPLDLLIASGNFHSARYEDPYVPGSEAVGVVLDSDRYAAGTWLYVECHASPSTPGAFAEQVLVPDAETVVLPAGVDPVLAAAVGNSGIAAFVPLVDIAGLGAGDTVVVLGATGSVGQLAVQIAHRYGAGRVVGVARDPSALDRLYALGADAVIELIAGEDERQLAARLLQAAGPADIVLDGLYGLPLQAALHACNRRAKVVNIGNLAGATAHIPAGLLRGKQISLTGFAGLHTPLRDKQAALTWLWDAVGRGELQLPVRTVDLAGLPAAWQVQAESPHVKCVVTPDASHLRP